MKRLGAPPALGGFDAEFFASNEAAFGGGEFAFNVFDNNLGGGSDKWCCGETGADNSGQGTNQIVGAHKFTSITLLHLAASISSIAPENTIAAFATNISIPPRYSLALFINFSHES